MATEKRILDTHTFWASRIIFDIEGTTTSISFVKDTLFPYVRKHLEQYLNDSWKDEGFQSVVAALREQAKTDENDGLEGFVAIPEGDSDEVKNAVIKNVLWQMDNDRKTKSLKDLQSLVMANGYETGNIIGHIYDDVDTNLKSWKDQGKLLYIYSSGSVKAQKLLFGNTNKGNLLNLFSGHFDTVVGPKTESSSYKKILDEMKSEPGDVLFFTDVPAEAKAAVGAGLQAVLVSRDGNAPLSDQDRADFTVIHSFSDIEFEQSTKKRKMLNDTNCDIVIDNKEVEHSSTYISETVNGEGDGQIKPNISVDTDVEMVEVEEKAICTGAIKEETKIIEEVGSCKKSDVDLKVQPNPELTKDNVKNSESIDENTAISSKNEIDRTSTKNPDVKIKNNVDIEGKKDDDIEGKKDDDIEGKKVDVEDKEEHAIEGKKEHDNSLVTQKKTCLADGEVGKESSVTDSSEDKVKPVEELNENTVKSIKQLSGNQHASIINNENGEVESESTVNEITKKSVDNNDKNEVELSRKSEVQEEAAVKSREEERNEISPVDKDSAETPNKTDIGTAEMINLSENNKLGLGDVSTDEVENKPREADIVKETGIEKNTHVVTVTEDGNDKEGNVKEHEELKKSEAVGCSVSSTAEAVEIAGNTVTNTTAIEIAEKAVSNTMVVEIVENVKSKTTVVEIAENKSNTIAVKIAENTVSNTTIVVIAENVKSDTIAENTVSNTTVVEIAENIDTVQPMDVSESNEDAECKADVLNPEENKPLSDDEMTRQNKSEQKMITDEVTTTETNGTHVCSVDNLPEKEMVEKENDINKKTELQEKIIIENSVCSKMETENCDVVSNACEKDNTLNEKSDAKKTVNESDVELQKEESKPLNNDEVCSDVGNINEKENNEESIKTENSKTEAVCGNSQIEAKVECSDVSEEKIINTNHEKGNCSDEKEDMTVTSVAVNGKRAENDSCDIGKNEGDGNVSKAQMEVTANGDTHESHANIKTDDEKTDTINEKTESNTVVNGGTENIADSVPEVKKVISDAANNSALEAISQPV